MASRLEIAAAFAREGRWDELTHLIKEEPELAHEENWNGETLLIMCAGFGASASVMEELVQLGADPNHRAHDGSNALAAAIVGGSRYGLTTLAELRTLLRLGADPNAVADCGMPALHWAIAQNRPEHAEVLLEHGARLDTKTADDPPESVEDVARRVRSKWFPRLLAEYRGRDKTS